MFGDKTLRDGSANLFPIRRNKNPDVCLVIAVDLYVGFAKGIVDLTNGILFRPTSLGGEIVDKPFSYSAADSRFNAYLG